MGPSKGLTEPRANARGYVRLNLLDGEVEAVVSGLSGGSYDLWLVDNAANSVLVDQDDRTRRVGRLRPAADKLTLKAQLGSEAFQTFEVDLVAISRAGQTPEAPAIAYGSPRTFQRLYTKQRLGTLRDYVNTNVVSSLLTSRAMAADPIVDPDVVLDPMVALGAQLFVNETFDGNGRTCNSCHPAANNFTLDPQFIATLPANDPLFVAEFNPALAELEVPVLLRQRALILENVDGFGSPGVLRSVPHTLALSTSLQPTTCVDPNGCQAGPLFYAFDQIAPEIDVSNAESSGFADLAPDVPFPAERTGWGGDGAPGSGSLREFAIGAIVQHLPKTLNRQPGVDFRLPTDEELDALELFQLSLGRSEDLDIATLNFSDATVALGRDIFMRVDTNNNTEQAGKCVICHEDAGANATPEHFGQVIAQAGLSPNFSGNQLFNTGINTLPSRANAILPGSAPRDAGFGILSLDPGDCVVGSFDFSQGFPEFIPGDPSTAPGGFGTRGNTPFVPPNLCIEAFNTPPLVEAADTPPFFHDNSFDTIEDAVAFYSSSAFNTDPLIELFIKFTDSGSTGINLSAESTAAVAKFLRAINALENLRSSREFDQGALGAGDKATSNQLLRRANQELTDAKTVLADASLHPVAVSKISAAISLNQTAIGLASTGPAWSAAVNQAVGTMDEARDDIVQ